MAIRLRIRSKQGGVMNVTVDGSTPLLQFALSLQDTTKIPSLHQKFLTGHPPTAVSCFEKQDNTIGDVVTVEEDAPPLVASVSVSATPQVQQTTEKPYKPPPPSQRGSIQKVQEGDVVRRKIADDNSCLFNAIGYVLESGSSSKASALRELVAYVVQEYTEGMLGKSKKDYATWIKLPNSWGGGIELSILAEEYRTEICAFDILTRNPYCYGEGQGYTQRVYLLYDGIHYDALVINLMAKDGPPELDITIFAPDDAPVKAKMASFVEILNKAGQFTDMASLKLVCGDCLTVLLGEKDMAIHAATTGHGNFKEIKK